MKINLRVLLLATTLAISVLSCKKQDAPPDQLTATTARAYFENQVKRLPKTETFNSLPIGEPNWDSAYDKRLSLGNGIVVPLKMRSYQTRANGEKVYGENYLLIYKLANGDFQHEVVSVLPSTSQESIATFNGTVIVRDYSGRIVKGFSYEEGKYTAVSITICAPRGAQTEIAMPCEESPTTVCFDTGNGYYCIVDVPVSSCGNGGSGGGDTGGGGYPGGGGLNPGVYPGVYPNPGGGSGGNQPGAVAVNEIRNDLTNSCLKNMLTKALNSELKNFVVNTVQEVTGYRGLFNFVILEAKANKFESKDDLGRFNPNLTYMSGAFTTLHIELNVDSLPILSNEMIATVIYHELIHAVLATQNVHIAAQHEVMAEAYRRHISDALRKLFPNLSDTDASALGWSGLTKTYQFSKIKTEDYQNKTNVQLAILKLVEEYEYNRKGTPSGCK